MARGEFYVAVGGGLVANEVDRGAAWSDCCRGDGDDSVGRGRDMWPCGEALACAVAGYDDALSDGGIIGLGGDIE